MLCWLRWIVSIYLLSSSLAAKEEAAVADSLAVAAQNEDAKAVLAQTVNETNKMRHTVTRVLHKSTEEVKTLKSLLTTNAKGAAALNELFMDMQKLTKRIAEYESGMASCQKEIEDLKLQSDQILTPQEASDPLIGSASLVQLGHHARTLHKQVSDAIKLHKQGTVSPPVQQAFL